MCGISGFNWKDKQKISEMVGILSYRGPDAEGLFIDEKVSLGHNRLSIIDLSANANQPMSDNAGELIIMFNGEIYNFKELKRELENGYDFKTNSDTEVILAGYKKWGRGVVKKLNGMFAFAIWNKKENILFCARDHMGMKPFYYFWDGERLVFASEVPSILVHDIPRKLNIGALNHYFRILYTPEPMTLIENIYKLPPAHTLTLQNGKLSIEPYGEEIKQNKLSYNEATLILKEKILNSVERHLISDVPIGLYLSGGIDSSIMLASMSKFKNNIETFSIGFSLNNNPEENKFNQDLLLARKTASHFGSNHNEVIISSKDVVNTFEEVATHNSDPISNPTSIAMFLLARFAKKKVTVALTGNAGDELFGGYDRYKTILLARFFMTPPDLFAKFMFQKDALLARVVDQNFLQSELKIKKYYEKYLIGRDAADSLTNADRQSWLPEHFFMLSDKMSMASALEERIPLADKEIVEFARSLPRKYKVDMRNTKKILKDAFKDELPQYLFDQPKRGWFSPAAKWFREPEFADLARRILSEGYYSNTNKLFNWPEIQEMLEKHIDKREYNLTILWAIITFQIWAKKFKIEL
ncbi:MAG: asparagine synthase (glutamine-hydrolyzing) [Crocinitomicaceae bacterium]